MLVVVRDVTSSRISQQRAQLQDRLAAVGQLAAGIAHDFNNILGTIMLYSEMMLNSGVVLPKDRERLATMFKQAQRGATLTSQILDFSRRSVMEEHELDLIAFLEDLKKLISISLPENVNVQYQFNGQDHLMVEADPTRMQQVIMNLALNSRDAMPQGGDFMLSVDSITVETGEPPYPGMAPGRWIQVKISDTGEGIPPDVLPHIFEPFFTTKPHGQGTGLGLAQVYGIIKQHDGYIDVESALGEGTAFTIYLPQIEMSTSEQDPSTDREEVFGEGETILVVEDDDATRRALCEILEDLGYRVFYAQDGSAAVKVLEAENGSIDLVISDLVMPHMGGRELYDIIQERFHQVQMILITGYPLGEQTRELLDRRKVNWIQKPLTSEELANAVRAMLDLVRFEGFGADGEG